MTGVTAQEAERRAHEALARNDFAEAESLARLLLSSGAGPLHIWALLAIAVRRQGRLDETRQIQEMLVGAVPQNVELRFDLAETLLLMGEFDRGWREYRFRYSLPHTKVLDRKVQRPRWEGEPIPGKTLLIFDEQGYGDTFQFMRMVPWAKERSRARVILQINHEQRSFAEQLPHVDQIVLRGEAPPPFDCYCEMMSLPMAMRLRLEDLPGTIPYLSASKNKIRQWKERLSRYPRPWVGLVWAGRPNHTNDANRSLTLDNLAPLGMDGITYFAIQKGPRAADATNPPSGMRLISLDADLNDFEDTAAVLSLLDVLVSCDSSPVHLAGALNRPAWVLLPCSPDWRWLMDRADTPWYPSVRLFRQSAWGDWDSVARNVAGELVRLRDGVVRRP